MLTDHNLTVSVDGGKAKGLHPDERAMASAIKRALQEHVAREAGSCDAKPDGVRAKRPRRPSARAAVVTRGMPDGWSVRRDEGLRSLLASLGIEGSGIAGGRLRAQLEGDVPAAVEPRGDFAAAQGVGAAAAAAEAEAAAPVRFLVMHEQGEPLSAQLLAEITPRPIGNAAAAAAAASVLVLGDHIGFTEEEEACMEELGGVRARVSPLPLLASHCIILAHAALDCAAAESS